MHVYASVVTADDSSQPGNIHACIHSTLQIPFRQRVDQKKILCCCV